MDWVDHDRLGFNYRLTELQAALGVAQLERLDAAARRPRAGRGHVHRAPRGARLRRARRRGRPRGAGAALRATVAKSAAAGSSTPVRLPAGADRDAVLADLAQRGVEAKAYMPSIHLMGFYRERFGYREGQFPVAEDASARLLALPFFAAITEPEIDRVCEALAEALRGDWT